MDDSQGLARALQRFLDASSTAESSHEALVSARQFHVGVESVLISPSATAVVLELLRRLVIGIWSRPWRLMAAGCLGRWRCTVSVDLTLAINLLAGSGAAQVASISGTVAHAVSTRC